MISIVSRQEASEAHLAFITDGSTALAGAILFGGDRWRYVERVARMQMDDGQIVGMASLASRQESGKGGPEIVGVWVHPDHRRQGYGLAMLRALVEESQHLYGQTTPTITPITPSGAALCRAAQRESIGLVIVPGLVLPIDL